MKTRLAGALLALSAALVPIASQAEDAPTAPATGWEFALTPYVWAPSIKGQLRYDVPSGGGGATSAGVGVDAVNLLQALNFAAMIAAEARNGPFSIMTDFIYLDLGKSGSNVRSVGFGGAGGEAVSASLNRGTETSLRGSLWTLAGGYTVASGGWGRVDAMAGFRLFSLAARTDVRLDGDIAGPGPGQSFARSGSLARDATLADAIAGVRGRVEVAQGFYLPYAIDVGTGASRITWQAMGGVAYQASWADIMLGYRHLYYDQSGSKLVQNFSFSGPFLALKFTF